MTPSISVVIPCFNEARRVGATVGRIASFLDGQGPYEILAVDDGSTDETPAVLRTLQHQLPSMRVLRLPANRGKGAAVRHGILRSTGALVLITDADLATPIEDFNLLRSELQRGADVAIGSRGVRDAKLLVRQPILRELLGRTFNLLVQAAGLRGIWDTQCGFKIFRGDLAREVFALSRVDGFAFDVEVLLLTALAGGRIREVPVHWSHIEGGHLRVARDGLQMLFDVVHLWAAIKLRGREVAELRSFLERSPSPIAAEGL